MRGAGGRLPMYRPASGGGGGGGGGARLGVLRLCTTTLLPMTVALMCLLAVSGMLFMSRRTALEKLDGATRTANEALRKVEDAKLQLSALQDDVERQSAEAARCKEVVAVQEKQLKELYDEKHQPLPGMRKVTPAAPPSLGTGPGGEGNGGAVEPAPKSPKAATALLIICYNRPAYLQRTLTAVMQHLPSYNRPHIYVSQDGDNAEVTAVIDAMRATMATQNPDIPVTHLRHPPVTVTAQQWVGYYKLSQHFKWALDQLFLDRGHPRTIILEVGCLRQYVCGLRAP